ncbi:efflux RND transporter permease subunit [Shumkonia mesophila]|uniref:efflux RND transporter permease subunit n=1 Tax=Shumkonia mesophila TaxID=2838854 RepID=UPI0029342F43|nr:efflux RND transporter permease subunit [Shumkonia mesophila]
MIGAIEFAIGRSRVVILVLLVILGAGAYAYWAIPKESAPDINIPIIYVTIPHEGISPEDAERLLIRPMEQELRTIEGVKEMRATAYEGGAYVLLEFEAGFDADRALDDVRERVDLAKPELPADTDEPTVHEVNFSLFPVLLVTLSGNVPERTLVRLARELQDSIEGLSSVLEAKIVGDRDEFIEILIDPVRAQSYGLTIRETIEQMSRSNLLVAAGSQDTGKGRFSVKVPGLFETVADVIGVPVKVEEDAVVRLGDIADVHRTFKDPESFARVNGKPAVTLEVSKRTGRNIIETIEAVRRIVAEQRDAWPDALRRAVGVSFAQDQSEEIRDMLRDLQNSVIFAVALVMIVIVVALGVRSSALVGVAVPGSFLASILVLASFGATINMVVLFGLILAVGLLVDASIIVTEYADRKMIEGVGRQAAYTLAAKRMAWPIIASTATTVAAFLPLLFWTGVVGEFMKFLPTTVVVVLSASLVMALIFVPTLGGFIGRPGEANAVTMRALAGDGDAATLMALGGLTGAYVRVLRTALHHPAKILLAALALLIGTQGLYATVGQGVEFFPDVEPKNAKLQIRARGNLSIHEMDALVREVEARIPATGEIETVYARIGAERNSQEAEDIIGSISLEFVDWDKRRTAEAILDEIRQRTAHLAGIVVDRRKQEEGPPVGKPIHLQITARDPAKLAPTVETIVTRLHEIPGLLNIEDSRPLPGIDWELGVDRAQAAKFGADVNLVGRALQMVTTGLKLGEYRPDDADDELDIRARYPRTYRTIEELDNVRISTPAGLVPISNFVERTAKPRVSTIKRIDGQRVMTVKADVAEGVNTAATLGEIQAWLARAGIDPSVRITYKGEDEEQAKSRAFLAKAFAIAVCLMAVILVAQFNSLYSSFLILSAVILSTIGVLLGLMLTGQPFGVIMSGVGVIALAGIVVNNNIILIDTYDRLIKEIADPLEAILRTGGQRLRPVLLTTITTILGLVPMMMKINIDFVSREVTIGAPASQWWSQLAAAIVFGLGFATILTLIVTPCALMLRINVREWRRRRRHRKPSRQSMAGVGT